MAFGAVKLIQLQIPSIEALLKRLQKFEKDLMEEAVDHINTTPICKLFLKELSRQRVDQNKKSGLLMLNLLQIPLIEE